jgi:membrane protein required for colicin V production
LNFLDIVIFSVVVYNTIAGLKRGLIRIFFEVLALVSSIFIAIKYYKALLIVIKEFVSIPAFYGSIFSFGLIWIAVFLFISMISVVIEKVTSLAALGFFNRIGGGIFGLAKGIVILLPVLVLLLYVNKSYVTNSILVQPLLPILKEQMQKHLPSNLNVDSDLDLGNTFKNLKNDSGRKKSSSSQKKKAEVPRVSGDLKKIIEENNIDLNSLYDYMEDLKAR